MYPSLGRIGYPIAKMRLIFSIFAAVFFSFLLYSASVNFKWFTVIRGFYLLMGIAEGVLVGWLEARIITRKLISETEMIPWQILPIGIVLLVLPLFLTLEAFGGSEFLPFAAYLVLPFVPAFYATSGWWYYKFEKKNKFRVFMFIYGLKYWTEPILDASDQFNQFIEAVALRDSFSVLGQAGQSKRLMATLEERQDIESSTRSALSNILKAMNEYRHRLLTVGSVFMISMLGLIVYFFVLASTNTFGLVEVVNNRIVSGQAIGLILLCVPTFSVIGGVFTAILDLRKGFQKRISGMLAGIDSNKLSLVENLNESKERNALGRKL